MATTKKPAVNSINSKAKDPFKSGTLVFAKTDLEQFKAISEDGPEIIIQNLNQAIRLDITDEADE